MARSETDSVFLSSVTDLMTSLAVLFILLLVVYVGKAHAEANSLNKEINKLRNFVQATIDIKKELKNELAKEKLHFEDDSNDALAIVYSVPDSKLQFDLNSAVLETEGKEYLQDIIPSVMRVVASQNMLPNIESILIEGHTDSSGDDEHNLELSQKRAFSVLQYGLNGCGLDTHEREWFLYFTSTSGRGERGLLPKGSKAGFENPAQSRRVEFKIRVKSIEQKSKGINSLTRTDNL